MASTLSAGQTLVGRTGTSYRLQKILYEREENQEIKHRLWLALSNNKSYVVKPVTSLQYEQALRIREDLAFSAFVRLPVDSSDESSALIFNYYTEDFLKFMHSGTVSRSQVKQILLDILRGIADCHSKDWVHSDIKPSNVLISYTSGPDGTRAIHSVSIVDTEDCAKIKDNEGIFARVGNVLWRSPEAQAGIGVAKASDVWSFGLTAAYGITKLVILAYDNLEEGVEPEIEVLANMLSYFGPLPKGLPDYIKDPTWCEVLVRLDESFDQNTPRKPFSLWRDIKGLEPGDKEFLKRILNLDPRMRPSARDLLNDSWFHSP